MEDALKGTGLQTIEIPKSMFWLGDGFLADCQFGCSSLDFIVILDSVKLIGQDAFTNTDKQFIIQCSFGSHGEEYARKNKFKYQLV